MMTLCSILLISLLKVFNMEVELNYVNLSKTSLKLGPSMLYLLSSNMQTLLVFSQVTIVEKHSQTQLSMETKLADNGPINTVLNSDGSKYQIKNIP